MFNKIDTMLVERFAFGESGLKPYDDNGIYIATAIEELFESEKFEKGNYSVIPKSTLVILNMHRFVLI